jgi:copper oxidase (laccase) domain-containing protein
MPENHYRQTFPSLSAIAGFSHAFTLRHPEIDVRVDRDEALQRLWIWHLDVAAELEFPPDRLATAQQVHGCDIAVITDPPAIAVPSVDGLISNQPNVMLGIYVADCCAVYLADPVGGAFGIVHSGKNGTALGITSAAIKLMQHTFGTAAENLIVQLSPCIRPPAYEVDFAAAIRDQARSAGVPAKNIHDDLTCTAGNPDRFYSYRREKGKTGRMLALLGKK